MSMESFTKSQEQMRETISRTFGGRTPIGAFEEQAQRNMALFQQALSMWTPFAAGGNLPGAPTAPRAAGDDSAAKDEQLDAMRRQLEAMQKQLEAMSKR
jgi:polyhydroxyalkanoate synthesis regulator protein